ncbi:MAG: hypothetical protein IKR14_07885, partial [Lachnospiraceae bacterium]|nr:hypothetical protein [Lachnospiraceae bacterium]
MGRKVQRDEIGFHNLLHQMREERAISRTMLRYGLFSDSEMHYIESGERLPDYLTRNRLMARLGVSAEGYEDFLQPSEYQRYLLSLELMDAVEHRMTGTAQERLVEMFQTCDSQNKLEKQFLLDMRGRIARQSGLPLDVISEIYEEAISLTVPNIDYHHLEKYVLAPEEYYYIFCWLDAFESRRDILPIIMAVLAHMLMRNMESITLSKILPKGAELYARCVLETESSNEVLLKHALDYLTEALSVLRKHHRLYYIEEVLEVRRQLLDALHTTGEYQEQIEENFRLLGAIKWLYSEYDIRKPMEDDCYIYRSSEVYSIADVIKGRRRQIGYSRDDLASGICSARTLMRIENSQTDSQWGIIKELFERLGISGVYRRTEFIENSHSMANLYEKYRFLSSNRQYSDAEKVLEEIKKRV